MEAAYAPALQGFEHLGSRREQGKRKLGQEFAFVAVWNQAHATESAGGADGGIGIAGQRQIGLHAAFAGSPRDGGGHILGEAEEAVEAGGVEGHGVMCRGFHGGRKLHGERGQIARAVKTGEHCFLR